MRRFCRLASRVGFVMLPVLTEPQAPLREDFGDLSPFREPSRARRDLERLRSRLPFGLRHLMPLLAGSPDPDQSLAFLERLTDEDREITRLLQSNSGLLQYAVAIFGHSFWLGETLVRHPDLLRELNSAKSLERTFEREDYSRRLAQFHARGDAEDISVVLARFRKCEYVRIALRDVLEVATLAETTAEISALADAIIEEALQAALAEMQWEDGHGRALPRPPFAALALGKLGGNELNYSSDLDLLYLYGGGETDVELGCDEYSVRLAQSLTNILARPTVEGSVFRVDLRLRPQGREGEPAVSLQRAIDYYLRSARDWELQALIKARYVAGDNKLADSFLAAVQSRIYTEDLNFAAVETALRSRQQIDARKRRPVSRFTPGAVINVKVDHGGIRDIEFLAQCLQRVYGGREPWLRSGGTLFSLQKLHDKDHLRSSDFQQLSQTYHLLRQVEHRLQLQRGRQVHELPQTAAELDILRQSLGKRIQPDSESLLSAVRCAMAGVSEVYRRVMHRDLTREVASAKHSLPWLARQAASFAQTIQRVSQDSPELAAHLLAANLDRHARRGLQRFLESAINAGETYSRLLADPASIIPALTLFANSDYLTEVLVHDPDALQVLGRKPELWEIPLAFRGDLQKVMAVLRREFRLHTLSEAACDIREGRSALDSMHQNTAVAEHVIQCAVRAIDAGQHLAVFALGRLGTYEFDIASDADLLFVREPGQSEQQARLLAEKLLHVLTAYTGDGNLFAVDARLRPRGGEGELVVTPEHLESYLDREAHSWEVLSYSKIRFIAGREDLATGVSAAVRECIERKASANGFANDVLEMRNRLEKSNRYAHSFKLARGGFYDIDFIASFLMLREAVHHDGNTLDRLEQLRRRGILDSSSFDMLSSATILYRTADHVIRIVTGRARPEIPAAEHTRQSTENLTGQMLGRDVRNALQRELDQTREQVRRIFLGLIDGPS